MGTYIAMRTMDSVYKVTAKDWMEAVEMVKQVLENMYPTKVSHQEEDAWTELHVCNQQSEFIVCIFDVDRLTNLNQESHFEL